MDWRNIDPSIFGTLFERGLNPAKRSQLGAHYTDPATILRLIEPVIVRPLAAEWQVAKDRIAALLVKSKKQGDKAHKDATALFQHQLERLRNFRVLDPACGSGNFLYLALKALKDLERRANVEAEALGLQRQVSIEVSPANVLGIELDPYAAELARVTVWIGEIQWMLRSGYTVSAQPILKPLDTIENRDALIKVGAGGTAVEEAEWPACDAIVGNPPFLGGTRKRGELGDAYFDALASLFDERVPPGADLVCYWFERARGRLPLASPKRRGWLPPTVFASRRIERFWSGLPIALESSRHGATSHGLMMARRCAFHWCVLATMRGLASMASMCPKFMRTYAQAKT